MPRTGRPKTPRDQFCAAIGCSKPAQDRVFCPSHAKAWRRAYDLDRCEWVDPATGEKCLTIVALNEFGSPRHTRGKQRGRLKRIDGRQWVGADGVRRSYCVAHMGRHLKSTPAVEAGNLSKIASLLQTDGDCWVTENRRETFRPVSGSTSEVGQWVVYIAVWAMLMPEKRQQGSELDHLTGCRRKARCCNPAHLQSVPARKNQWREFYRKQARKTGVYDTSKCGPMTNQAAAKEPRVIEFALQHGLPCRLKPRAGKAGS